MIVGVVHKICYFSDMPASDVQLVLFTHALVFLLCRIQAWSPILAPFFCFLYIFMTHEEELIVDVCCLHLISKVMRS